jgi:DNA modification methylase
MVDKSELQKQVPDDCDSLLDFDNSELRHSIPELARDWDKMMEIENVVRSLDTTHRFIKGDARDLGMIDDESVHLVVTSPPYFNIKDYNRSRGQLGSIENYGDFLSEIEEVWRECINKLKPGGRMCIVTGDILQSRRMIGRHRVLPLHSSIQEQCLDIGFDCLAPIIWSKIGNATLEAGGNSRFLGKPYEPGGVIKNDIEYILIFKKRGDYRSPTVAERILSTIRVDEHKEFFRQVWTDINGASSKNHPAPYPTEIAERLIRMFSFVGDTIMDPFAGIGTTAIAASKIGRNSVNVEIDREYISTARRRLREDHDKSNEISMG